MQWPLWHKTCQVNSFIHRVSVFDHPADRRLKSVHPFRKAANTTHVMARWPLSIKNNCRVISVLCIYGWTWKVYLLFILDTSIYTNFFLFVFFLQSDFFVFKPTTQQQQIDPFLQYLLIPPLKIIISKNLWLVSHSSRITYEYSISQRQWVIYQFWRF